MSVDQPSDPISKPNRGVELKNVSGLLALAATVLTTLGFVTRFLSFRWSPVFSIRQSALALTTLTSPIDWLTVGVMTCILSPLNWLGGLVLGNALANTSQQSLPSVRSIRILLLLISLPIFVSLVFVSDARQFLTWGLPLLAFNLLTYFKRIVHFPLNEVVSRVAIPLLALMLWLAVTGGFTGPIAALHEKLTIDGKVHAVLVVADSPNVVSFIRCDDKTKSLTTVERGSISERVVVPFVTKRKYPTIAKLFRSLFTVDGLDVGVRSSC